MSHSSSRSFRLGKALKSPKKKTKKVVRFNSCVTARPFLHKNNYTAKETAATWYSATEFEGIRKDVLETLSLMRSGNLVEPEDYVDDEDDASTVATSESGSASRKPALQSVGSYRNKSSKGTTNIYDSNRHQERTVSTSRGLENYTAKGSIKSNIRKARQNAVWAVMEEQDLQVDRAECLKLTYLWYDDEAIREVYRKHSKPALKAARLLGVVDSSHGAEPAMMPRRQSLTLRKSNSTHHSSPTKKKKKKNLRKLFQKSSGLLDEKTLIEKAAAAFPEKGSRHSPKQRRWSLLGSGRRGSLTADGPNNPTALVA